MTEQALAGLKVLDLSHHIAGPYCTRILAGFGADVIKIEKPGEGDPARSIGPFLNDEAGPERSGLFLYLNSNKKSITLNLKSNAGVKIFRELVKDADVVVENFNPRVMKRLGLDYQTLEKINPGLVMTSISNFGQTGPYRDYKLTHLTALSMSGGRYSDAAPGEKPIQIGGWLTHYIAGIHGLIGTATALYQRNETGIGQHVDVSILESIIMSTCYPTVAYSYLGEVHNHVAKAFLGILPCKDGYIGLNVFNFTHWELLCAFFGMPELSKDPRFQTLQLVSDNVDEARAIFAPLVMQQEKMQLFESGVEWRITLGAIPTTQEVLDSPQHKARGFFEEVDHSVMGKVTMPGAPFNLIETPWQLRSPAPTLGEHNEDVYCHRLGYSREDLARLREQQII